MKSVIDIILEAQKVSGLTPLPRSPNYYVNVLQFENDIWVSPHRYIFVDHSDAEMIFLKAIGIRVIGRLRVYSKFRKRVI